MTAIAAGDVTITGTTTDGSKTATPNLTLLAALKVGDLGPAGGYIFYDDVADGVDDIPNYRYLEAAPADLTEKYVWGTNPKEVSGAEGTEIGTGLQNTLDILAGDDLEDNAANACTDYSLENNGTTYDDWFLPSEEELQAIHSNLYLNSLGGFTKIYYSTSTEATDKYARGQYFANTTTDNVNKSYTLKVRPVRSF